MRPYRHFLAAALVLLALTTATQAAFLWDALGSPSRTIFVGTADGISCSNTTAATTIVPTGWGTNSVIKNTWAVGKNLKIRMGGLINTATNVTLTIKILLGTTQVACITNAVPDSDEPLANQVWRLDADVTCRTIGATGTFAVTGTMTIYDSDNSGFVQVLPIGNALPTAQTVDTTATKAVNVTATFSDDVANSVYTYIITQNCVMEMSR